jgi:peptidoglycan/LPS O-acetylase OafA/YrhL
VSLIAAALVMTLFTLSPASDSPMAADSWMYADWACERGPDWNNASLWFPTFRLFNLRPLRILGKYSYGFYVYHLVWAGSWRHFAALLTDWLHSRVLGGILMNVVNFSVTFIVAKLSYDLFESHFLRLKKNFKYDSELRMHKHASTVE